MSENNFYNLDFDGRYPITPDQPDDTLHITTGSNVWFDLNDVTNTIVVNAMNGLASINVNGTEVSGEVLTLLAGDDIVLIPDEEEGTITIQADRGAVFDTFNIKDENSASPVDVDLNPSQGANTLTLKAGENINLMPNTSTNTVEIIGKSLSGDSFGVINVNDVALEANEPTDTVSLVAGDNITLSTDAAERKIEISSSAIDSSPSFGNVKVGNTNIQSITVNDTLSLVAGDNITLTPNASNKTLTITATGGGGSSSNAFGRFRVSGTNINASTAEDTVSFEAGNNITLTPNVSSKSITINADGGSTQAFNTITSGQESISASDYESITVSAGTGIKSDITDNQIEFSTDAFNTIIIQDVLEREIGTIHPTNAANTFKMCSPDDSIEIYTGDSGTTNENTIYMKATGGGGGGSGDGVQNISFGDGYIVTPDESTGSIYLNDIGGNLYAAGGEPDPENYLTLYVPSLEGGDGITVTGSSSEEWSQRYQFDEKQTISLNTGTGLKTDPETGEISLNTGTGFKTDPETGEISLNIGTGFKIDPETGELLLNLKLGTGLALIRDSICLEPRFMKKLFKQPLEGTAYALFDSDDGTLTFTRSSEKFENRQQEGTVTVYTGIEDSTHSSSWTDPDWLVDHREDILTIVFNDCIRPTLCSKWFAFCSHLVLNIRNIELLDWSRVDKLDEMFAEYPLETLDLSSNVYVNTDIATNMSRMFYGSTALRSLYIGFNTSNVTDMSEMFGACSSLETLSLSSFNTSNVTNMYHMFGGCSSLSSLDVSSFDTSNVTNMVAMFGGCSSLNALNVSNFNTSNVTNMTTMFGGCSSLNALDVSNFNTSNVTNMSEMFTGCSSLETLDLENFDTSNVTDMTNMFMGCSDLSASIIIRNAQTNMSGMCYNAATSKDAEIVIYYDSRYPEISGRINTMIEAYPNSHIKNGGPV